MPAFYFEEFGNDGNRYFDEGGDDTMAHIDLDYFYEIGRIASGARAAGAASGGALATSLPEK